MIRIGLLRGVGGGQKLTFKPIGDSSEHDFHCTLFAIISAYIKQDLFHKNDAKINYTGINQVYYAHFTSNNKQFLHKIL